MVFCNLYNHALDAFDELVTILILIDGFLQCHLIIMMNLPEGVTILILIDGFLQ